MHFSDVSSNMATIKAGGTTTVPQSTKLILPHEMLTANGTTPIAASSLTGHSTTTILLPNSHHHFYHTTNTFQGSNLFNNSNDINHTFRPSTNATLLHNNLLTTTTATTTATTTNQNTNCLTNSSYDHHHHHLTIGNHHHQHLENTANLDKSAPSNSKSHMQENVQTEQQNLIKTEDDQHGEQTNASHVTSNAVTETEAEEDNEIDIVINNVVCSFSVRCHLNLRTIALNGYNVEFRRENGMVTMKLRKPHTTASIWSSGRITCTGATSEDEAKRAARRYARCLQKLGFRVRFNNFRVVNVLGTCSMPWAIKITQFSERYRKEASYEPELHPGVTYKLKEPKATLKIFSTGSITVTAASVSFVQQAIEHIYPLVYEFRKKRTPDEEKTVKAHLTMPDPEKFDPDELIEVDADFDEQQPPKKRRRPAGNFNDPATDIMHVSDADEESDDDL